MTDFQWVAMAIVSVLSAARISRLFTQDTYPPSVWLRIKWDALTNDGPWSKLAHCGFCLTVWVYPPILLLGWACDWSGAWGAAWWIFNGCLAGAYAAAIVQSHDGD